MISFETAERLHDTWQAQDPEIDDVEALRRAVDQLGLHNVDDLVSAGGGAKALGLSRQRFHVLASEDEKFPPRVKIGQYVFWSVPALLEYQAQHRKPSGGQPGPRRKSVTATSRKATSE